MKSMMRSGRPAFGRAAILASVCGAAAALMGGSSVALGQSDDDGAAPVGDVNPRVIYGSDSRIEPYQVTDPVLADVVRAACIVTFDSEVTSSGALSVSPWTSAIGGTLCPDEPFRGQLTVGFCSGFLVGSDIVVTAGHCVPGVTGVTNSSYVFGFEVDPSSGVAPSQVPANHVYRGVELLDSANFGDLDYAVVRLDRPVDPSVAMPIPIRRTGEVAVGTPLVMIGHPATLPKKVAGDATVTGNTPGEGFFRGNVDAYGGNSGSMVINANTYEIEGILVFGAADYTFTGGCVRSNVLPQNGQSGEGISKADTFADFVPLLGVTAASKMVSVQPNWRASSFMSGSDNSDGLPVEYVITSLPSRGVLWVGSGESFVSVTSLPAGGLNVGGNGSFVYRADLGEIGADSFTYKTVTSQDESGDATVSLSIASTPIGEERYAFFNFNTNPGWSTGSSWAFGQPTGSGDDPDSGATGNNVYGTNLSGDYPSNLNQSYLTSGAIDLSDAAGTKLRFQRWLSIEDSRWDEAWVEVSANNGGSWTRVWEHTGASLFDNGWTEQVFEVPQLDGRGQARIRWGIGSDSIFNYGGWNIDDVEFFGDVFGNALAIDLNRDQVVDLEDAFAFLDGYALGLPEIDLNGDGSVDLLDAFAFLDLY